MSKHMAALWKRCAKKLWSELDNEIAIANYYRDRVEDTENRISSLLELERNEWKARAEKAEAEIATLKEENDFLREHSEAQANRIDELPELWAETAKLKHELAALPQDARMVAELVVTVNWSGKLAATVEAAHRILEATKEKP